MTRIDRLADKFRDQEDFARDYSPLYSILFCTVASWLQSLAVGEDPLVQWLVDISNSMRSLNVTLLLAAGLWLASGSEVYGNHYYGRHEHEPGFRLTQNLQPLGAVLLVLGFGGPLAAIAEKWRRTPVR